MNMIESISVSGNRVAVIMKGRAIQFAVWDLEKSQHKALEEQLRLAFGICSNIEDIEKHLQINGFDASYEGTYKY